MNGPAWRPQVQKLHMYEGIFNLNRAFHATLLSLERLENLGFFRAEYLNACKIELEHTRASANGELIKTLRDYEQDEGGRFYRMQKEWEDQLKDPDDIFLEAKSRKEEIKEQMKGLQHGLDLMKPKKNKARSARKRKASRTRLLCRCGGSEAAIFLQCRKVAGQMRPQAIAWDALANRV